MEMNKLPKQEAMVHARRLIARLTSFRTVFTLSSSGYCAIHWLSIQRFSISVLLSALVFGSIVAMAVAWLPLWFRSSQATLIRSRVGRSTNNDISTGCS